MRVQLLTDSQLTDNMAKEIITYVNKENQNQDKKIEVHAEKLVDLQTETEEIRKSMAS